MVVVTTNKDRRGVFFGELVSGGIESGAVKLKEAQMCVYWSEATRGILGLASIGPQKGSKITPLIPEIELDGVTAIMQATKEAEKLWRECPWG